MVQIKRHISFQFQILYGLSASKQPLKLSERQIPCVFEVIKTIWKWQKWFRPKNIAHLHEMFEPWAEIPEKCFLSEEPVNSRCLDWMVRLGFQVFLCKCLDSQDFARAWAVCAQLGPCLDSQGSLQDLASLSCLSSVGEILLSSCGSSVFVLCLSCFSLLEQCCCPLWEPCFWTLVPVELRWPTMHGIFIQISLYSGT